MRARIVILTALLALGTAVLLLLVRSEGHPPEPAVTAGSLEREFVEPLDRAGSSGPLRVLTRSSPGLETGFRNDPELLELLQRGREAEIQVAVVGPDSRPQAGATVTLEPSPGSAAADQVLADERRSDSRGEVVFAVPRTGTFRLVATHHSLQSERITGVRPGSRVLLRLRSSLPFSGQIVAAGSELPIPDALVLFEFDAPGGPARRVPWTRSGPDGRFELDLPAGARGRLEVLARGYARTKTWLDTRRGAVRVSLETGHELTGSVLDASGQPARDVTVRTVARRRNDSETLTVVLAESRTDALGRFTLGPTACDEIELEAVSDRGDRVTRQLDRSAALQALRLVLPGRHRLAGRVTLADLRPAAGARIRLLGLGASEATRRRVVADSEGRFEIERIQTRKPYRLAVWHPQGTPVILERPENRGPGQLEIRLPAPNGIRGLVRRQDGTPAPFAVLSVDHDDSGLVRAAGLREQIRADQTGRFRIRAVPPGEWRLSAVFEDQAVGPQSVWVQPGQVTELVLELEGRVSLQGELIDALGRPVPGGTIEAHLVVPEDQAAATVLALSQADAAGRFQIDRLPPDLPVELSISSPGYQQQRLLIPRPGQSGPLVIRMTELLILSGQVLDRVSGAPLERFSLTVAWTTARGDRRERKRSFVSADGSFRFESLDPGLIELTVKARDHFRFGPEPLALDAAAVPLVVRLDPASRLDGRLLDDRGRALAGTLVFLRELPLESGQTGLRRSRSRADGRFTLAELAPGRYELGVGRPGTPLALVPVKLKFGPNSVRDLHLAQVGSVELELSGPDGQQAGERVVRFVGQTLKARLEVVSDARGRAEVGPLPADIYEVLCDGARGSCVVRAGAVTPLRLSIPREAGG